jgi:enamine deaminase RidA (YjgF/YER057c/UK114 family)
MSREKVTVGKPWEKSIRFGLGVKTSGKLLYTAGITARDPDGTVVGVGDMQAQIQQVFKNLRDILRAAGTDFEHVIKYTIYTTDIAGFLNSGIWDREFRDRPAATTVEVRRLATPEMLVEVEAVVEVP